MDCVWIVCIWVVVKCNLIFFPLPLLLQPNVIHVYEMFDSPEALYIVLELYVTHTLTHSHTLSHTLSLSLSLTHSLSHTPPPPNIAVQRVANCLIGLSTRKSCPKKKQKWCLCNCLKLCAICIVMELPIAILRCVCVCVCVCLCVLLQLFVFPFLMPFCH